MKNLIVVGARGFGREVYNTFVSNYASDDDITFKGFLDSKADALDGFEGYPGIIGSPEDYQVKEDDVFFIAMGDVRWRRHYAELMKAKGAEFFTIINKTSVISRNVTLGAGCYVSHGVTISCDIQIGDFTFFFGPTVIGHDARIGSFCHLGSFCFMGGGSHLEDDVTLHPGSKILPHKTVGQGATVGAGSVVIRNVKPGSLVMGVPAKKVEF